MAKMKIGFDLVDFSNKQLFFSSNCVFDCTPARARASVHTHTYKYSGCCSVTPCHNFRSSRASFKVAVDLCCLDAASVPISRRPNCAKNLQKLWLPFVGEGEEEEIQSKSLKMPLLQLQLCMCECVRVGNLNRHVAFLQILSWPRSKLLVHIQFMTIFILMCCSLLLNLLTIYSIT